MRQLVLRDLLCQFLIVSASALAFVATAHADVPIIGPRVICQGAAFIRLEAATGYTSYRWNTGDRTAVLIVTQGGRYVVMTVDSTGKVDSGIVVIREVQRPKPRIGNPFEYICAGELADLRAPQGFVSYLWNTGATTPSISIAKGGTYHVTVVDTNGCAGTSDAIQVIVTARATPSIEGVNAVCLNAVAIYTTSAEAGVLYTWSVTGGSIVSGQGTPTARIAWVQSGNVRLTASTIRPDGISCDTTVSLFVRVGSQLRPQLLYDRGNICEGDSIELRAASGFLMYRWNTGATTTSIIARTAGTYFVEVEDSTGCQGISDTVVVTVYKPPVVRIGGPAVICPNGRVILTGIATTSDVVLWQWSTGARTESIVVDAAGLYTVVGWTINGCSDTARFTVRNAIPVQLTYINAAQWDTTDVGVTVSKTIRISNAANVDVIVNRIEFTASIPTVFATPPTPIRIAAQGYSDISFYWTADAPGDVTARALVILEQDGCVDTAIAVLTGHSLVPLRTGTVDAWIADTTVDVGAMVDLPLTMAVGVSRPETVDIDIDITWEETVFHVIEIVGADVLRDVTTGSVRNVTLRFSQLSLPRARDTVITMRGRAMLGGSLRTLVDIRRLVVTGLSTYDVSAQDGSVSVIGCWLQGRLITFAQDSEATLTLRAYTIDGRCFATRTVVAADIRQATDVLSFFDETSAIGFISIENAHGHRYELLKFVR